jgi:hypothetical protein
MSGRRDLRCGTGPAWSLGLHEVGGRYTGDPPLFWDGVRCGRHAAAPAWPVGGVCLFFACSPSASVGWP